MLQLSQARTLRQDCFLPDRRLNKTTQQSRREESQRGDSQRERQNRSQSRGQNNLRTIPNRAHQALENKTKHDNDSDPEPFAPEPNGTAFMVKEQQDL